MTFYKGQHIKYNNQIFVIEDVEQYYYHIKNKHLNFKVLKNYVFSDSECKSLDMKETRKNKLIRVFSNPKTCGDCNFCIECDERGFIEYFCKPIKEKYGYNSIEPTDESKVHGFCRWNEKCYKIINVEDLLNEQG